MKTAMLLSGGVDSSVALATLAQSGSYDLTAFYLKIWLEDDLAHLGSCPWEEDLEYASAVCDRYGVELKVIPLQSEYWDRVVSYTIDSLRAGLTPSPDILCNQRVKYGAFREAVGSEFDYIASGHYARAEHGPDSRLFRAVDDIKDQSYFLSHLSQTQLRRCLFPLGELPKSRVRELATQLELPNQDRPDSQGICFLGKIKYNDFVDFHLGKNPGPIRDIVNKETIGEHLGLWYHTIGQRKGLGLSGGPWYVVHKDVGENCLYVCQEENSQDFGIRTFRVRDLNWLQSQPELESLGVKVRHGAKIYAAKVSYADEDIEVTLDESDRGLACGQFAVFYDGYHCLGGGTISKTTLPL